VSREKEIIDLTRSLDQDLEIYSAGKYEDPKLTLKPWASLREEGFRVSQVSLGTQTGTHIDAPSHFTEDGATLEQFPVRGLLGPYCWINLDTISGSANPGGQVSAYKGESILFLASPRGHAKITKNALFTLCSLPAGLWVLSGSVSVEEGDPFYFNRAAAEHGIFLVEDLEPEASKQVKPGGKLIALPLKLSGVSGAPCRVVVIQ